MKQRRKEKNEYEINFKKELFPLLYIDFNAY